MPNPMANKSDSQKLHIAIVGGGIGGLALAVSLTKLNILEFLHVEIYEAAASLNQVGAGITLWPRAWEILKNMGLETSLAARFSPDQMLPDLNVPKLGFVYRKSDQKEGVLIEEVRIPGGSLSFHRADIQEVLLNHLSHSIRINLSHRLKTYQQTGAGVNLEFTNGVTASCDVLIGADGINSAVRRTFLAEGKNWLEEEKTRNGRPLWTGTYVYRSLIDSGTIRREAPNHRALKEPMVYCGKNKHVVAYPVSQGRVVNVVTFISRPAQEGTYVQGPAVIECTTDNLAEHFSGWEEEVTIIIKHSLNSSRWAVQTLKPLDTYASGRVALLGDAAHAMAPHLGNGAGQAIEDANIIANILAKAIRKSNLDSNNGSKPDIDIPFLTNIYTRVRQPFGNFAVAATRDQGLFYEFNGPGYEDIQDGDEVSRERLDKLGEIMRRNWDWTWKSANDDLRRALRLVDCGAKGDFQGSKL